MLKCIRGSLALKYVEFKNGLDEGQEYGVYLFEGEDAFFRERGFNLLKNKFVQEPSINCVTLESDVSVSQLTASLNGYPFLSQKKMTVIREFYPKAEYLKSGLKEYLDSPSDSSIFVVLNEKPCESLKKFSSVCVVDCGKADLALLIRWIRSECIREGVSIESQTAQMISEYCLGDMTRIQNETQKLIAYAGKGGLVTAQAVEDLVSRSTEYKIYEMTDFIARKKFDSALEVIHDLTSKGETPHGILTYTYTYFRRLLHVAISGKSALELSKLLGIKEFAVKKAMEQASKFKKRSLKNAVDALTDTDYKIKSGQLDADDGVYLAIFKIITENK